MGVWTLTHDGVTRTLREWGMQDCAITEQSLTAGIFSATIPGDMLATLPWAYEDTITLELDGVRQWKGVALSPRRQTSGNSELVLLRFADPWWYFGQASYRQPWFIAATGTSYDAPRVALFADVTPGTGWLKLPISLALSLIISQCNAYYGGQVMMVGEFHGAGFAAQPIPQRVLNATYESVIREALAWVPDAIQQWDYSTEPPTLTFVQRAVATVRTFDFQEVLTEQQLVKNDALVVRGIEMTYAGLDAQGHVTKMVDQAGETTGTRLLKTVIDCTGTAGAAAATTSGTPEITRKYTVVSEAIDFSAEWWFEYGDTGAESAADIVVGECSMELASNAPENAGKGDLGGCSLQWLSGGIPKSRVSANTRVALITGHLTVRTTKAGEDGDVITSTEIQEKRIIKLLMPVTKLSGEYTQVIANGSSGVSPVVPQLTSPLYLTFGIAQLLLNVWSIPQWDGEISLVREECDVAVALGDVVNISGGLPEWEGMDTQVQSIVRKIDTGTTALQLGVATHLGLDEYANLLNMSRARPIVVAADLDQQAMGQVIGPEPDDDDDGQDDMMGPGSVKSSVLYGPQKVKVTTSKAEHTTDMTAAAGPTVSNKDTDTDDEVVTEPGKQTVRNLSEEASNTSTPKKIELRAGEGQSITIDVENGIRLEAEDGSFINHDLPNNRTLYQDEAGNSCEVKPTKIELLDEEGNGITLSSTGLVIRNGEDTTELTLGQLRMIVEGKESTLEPAHLLLTGEDGATNSLSDEQMVLNNGSKTAIYEAGKLSFAQEGGSASFSIADGVQVDSDGATLSASPFEVELDDDSGNSSLLSATAGLKITEDDNTATVNAAVMKLQSGDYEAKMTAADGIDLTGSDGRVAIKVQEGKEISFQDTETCEEDEEGEPTTKTSKVLKSDEDEE